MSQVEGRAFCGRRKGVHIVVSRLKRAQGPIHGSTRADALREHRCGQQQGAVVSTAFPQQRCAAPQRCVAYGSPP